MWLGLILAASIQSQSLLERPDAEGPIQVQVGIYVGDVIQIDEPAHLFTGDVFFELAWRDDRLAGGPERKIGRGEAWSPEVVLFNERFTRSKLPEVLRVDGEGNVRYVQRFSGTFNTSFDLRDFPFDRQVLHFDLVIMAIPDDEIDLSVNPDFTGQRTPLTITDWKVGTGTAHVRTFEPLPGIALASYVYEIPVERRVGFYVWKILLPLLTILCMAGSVFWIDPKNSGPQISVAVSSMLTLIAYRFLLGNLVPKLSYLTRMDHFIMGATVMVFAALIVVVVTSGLAAGEHHERALRIDRTARVVYPLAIVALLLVAFVL